MEGANHLVRSLGLGLIASSPWNFASFAIINFLLVLHHVFISLSPLVVILRILIVKRIMASVSLVVKFIYHLFVILAEKLIMVCLAFRLEFIDCSIAHTSVEAINL